MFKPLNFTIEELVDRATFEARGNKSWELLCPRALMTLQDIRNHFGAPVTVNTWARGGNFSQRGLRSPLANVGSQYSQHKFGRAFDLDVQGMSAEEVRQEIIRAKNEDPKKFPYMAAIELGVNWFHFDTRNTGRGQQENGGLFCFNP
jgi:hypothetical protein